MGLIPLKKRRQEYAETTSISSGAKVSDLTLGEQQFCMLFFYHESQSPNSKLSSLLFLAVGEQLGYLNPLSDDSDENRLPQKRRDLKGNLSYPLPQIPFCHTIHIFLKEPSFIEAEMFW